MRKNPRILITNDDGIHAPGLEVLEKVARDISTDVWVVAPEVEQSGAGHSLTLNSPMRYREVSHKRFAVKGTPTDCVLLAVREIIPGKIDLVLSGINRGKNIGEDITHSGTVAGALEGTLCDIPSIAFSQNLDFGNPKPKVHWKTAEKYAPGIIAALLAEKWERDTLFNVNFPDCAPAKVKGIKVAAHGKRHIPKQITRGVDPKGHPFFWLNWPEEGADDRRPDCDIKWLVKNYVTVTPLCMDMTNYTVLKRIKSIIEK
jgi:5'-nucleotidase